MSQFSRPRLDLEALRLATYHGFVEDGRPPGISALAERFTVEREAIVSGLRDLARRRHIVLSELDSDDPAVIMAHPFSAIPLGFAVMGRQTLWWGGCAWDSFALPHLLPDEPEVLVATTCPACHRGHAWVVNDCAPPEGEQVAHFLVPAARMWDDVVHTCANQRIFCNRSCVTAWLDATSASTGAILDLAALWQLAAHWYDGRLDHGYARRDPADATDYLRGVGLGGPFWDHS